MKNLNNLKILIVLLLFPLLFIGCSQEKVFSSVDSTETEEFIEESLSTESLFFEEDFIVDSNDSNITLEIGPENEFKLHSDYIYESKIDWLVDLDGDGISETVYYETEIINDERKAHLWINGVDFGKYVDIYEPLDTHFFIVDTNKEDDYFEMIVSTYGMSDDLESQWFRYSDGLFFDLGYTEMMPNNSIYFNNDSSVTVYTRTDIFGTNFIPIKYVIDRNKLKKVNDKFYNFGLISEKPYIASIDIVVHTKDSKNSDTITLNKGTEFFSIKTDGKEWVNILAGKNEYWLNIEDGFLIDNENVFITDAVKNLILAD